MTAEADVLSSVKTIVTGNWTSANTNSITPDFWLSTEQPLRLDYSNVPTNVLFYLVSHTTSPNDLGASHRERTVDRVSIDIRSKESRAHLLNCYNECRRIFSGKVNNPDGSFAQWLSIGFQDFSKSGFFRYVYDIELKNWIVTR